ncbi:MAG: OmpW family outer membrane protein [Halieaceae bacterium]|jgi:outer membrane protein|nr:OmpW family outer membrane protein [Halieaceae bacterium]
MKNATTLACSTLAFGLVAAPAMAEKGTQIVKSGYAYTQYNNSSSELSGPATPGGITAEAKDHGVLALTYEYFVTDHWSLQLAGGLPPTVKLVALGTAAQLGEVGETTAVFPGFMALYNHNFGNNFTVYGGGGFNYTLFTDSDTFANYDEAFGGNSRVDIDDSFGGLLKVGASYHLNDRWLLDVSYSRYWITADATITTDTAGVGDIARTIEVDVDPNVYSVLIGFKF